MSRKKLKFTIAIVTAMLGAGQETTNATIGQCNYCICCDKSNCPATAMCYHTNNPNSKSADCKKACESDGYTNGYCLITPPEGNQCDQQKGHHGKN